MQTDTLIVGGGLSGLALAARLAEAGRSFLLVEARDRLGGRIKTMTQGPASFDLGPAWFWPGQPRIDALVTRLGLRRFAQHAKGALTHEDVHGRVTRGMGFSSMEGSLRLEGGFSTMIHALAATLPPGRVLLSTPVTSLTRAQDTITATTPTGPITARTVVLALPPRLAAGIGFAPPLPRDALTALQTTPTWMAGQAKAIAVYDRPFWREAGLSGDAMSRLGPMVEIHDASPADGGPHALFGFIGVPPEARADTVRLKDAVRAQFARLFGPDAAKPLELAVKDWAADPFTATELDQKPLYAHPPYGLPPALADLWDGRLILGGTEVAPQFGGYLEGALEAAENAVALLHQGKHDRP